jgi:hypothetical protein
VYDVSEFFNIAKVTHTIPYLNLGDFYKIHNDVEIYSSWVEQESIPEQIIGYIKTDSSIIPKEASYDLFILGVMVVAVPVYCSTHRPRVPAILLTASIFFVGVEGAPVDVAGVQVVQHILSQRFLVLGLAAAVAVTIVKGTTGTTFSPSFNVAVTSTMTVTGSTASQSLFSGSLGKSKVREAIEEGCFPGAFQCISCDDPVSEAVKMGFSAARIDGMHSIVPNFFGRRNAHKAARGVLHKVRELLKSGLKLVDIAYDPYQSYAKDGNPVSCSSFWRHQQFAFTNDVVKAAKVMIEADTKLKDKVTFSNSTLDADRVINFPIPGHSKVLIIGTDTDFLFSISFAASGDFAFASNRALFLVNDDVRAKRLSLIYMFSFADPMHKNDESGRLCSSIQEMEEFYSSSQDPWATSNFDVLLRRVLCYINSLPGTAEATSRVCREMAVTLKQHPNVPASFNTLPIPQLSTILDSFVGKMSYSSSADIISKLESHDKAQPAGFQEMAVCQLHFISGNGARCGGQLPDSCRSIEIALGSAAQYA